MYDFISWPCALIHFLAENSQWNVISLLCDSWSEPNALRSVQHRTEQLRDGTERADSLSLSLSLSRTFPPPSFISSLFSLHLCFSLKELMPLWLLEFISIKELHQNLLNFINHLYNFISWSKKSISNISATVIIHFFFLTGYQSFPKVSPV
jgi:hypothetical protein